MRIWEIILERNPRLMDHEFSGHRGCVLELVVRFGGRDLLQMLLERGADTMRDGDPVLDMPRVKRADRDTIELIKRFDSRWMKGSQEQ